jgi:hypothetical protein
MNTVHLVAARLIVFVVRTSFAFTIAIMMTVSVGGAAGELFEHEGVPDPGPSRNEVTELLARIPWSVSPGTILPVTRSLIEA